MSGNHAEPISKVTADLMAAFTRMSEELGVSRDDVVISAMGHMVGMSVGEEQYRMARERVHTAVVNAQNVPCKRENEALELNRGGFARPKET